MIALLADTTGAPVSASPGGLYQFVHLYAPILLIGVIMWVALILPKRRQDKTHKSMLESMKRGDEVQTIGGIIGKVVEPREDRVLVKVDESSNTKIWFARSAIARVNDDENKAVAK